MGVNYNPKIVTDGLVLYLDAANPKSYPGSGTTWFDLSKNGNDGTLVNGVGYSNDNQGSMVFDGTNDYIENSTQSFNLTGNIEATLEGWFYFTGSNSFQQYTSFFVYGGGPSAGDTISIGLFDNFRISASFNGGLNAQTSQNILLPNTWNHIVITKTPGPINTTTKIYMNKIEQTIVSAPTNIPNITSRVVRVGRWTNEGNPYYYQGKVSVCTIYNRALTESEIRQNFNATRGRYGV